MRRRRRSQTRTCQQRLEVCPWRWHRLSICCPTIKILSAEILRHGLAQRRDSFQSSPPISRPTCITVLDTRQHRRFLPDTGAATDADSRWPLRLNVCEPMCRCRQWPSVRSAKRRNGYNVIQTFHRDLFGQVLQRHAIELEMPAKCFLFKTSNACWSSLGNCSSQRLIDLSGLPIDSKVRSTDG